MKQQFINLLSQAQLPNQDAIVRNLERLGFFEAPASTKFHLSREGGLLEHSLSVCNTAIKLREVTIAEKPEMEQRLPLRSVILVSLLHDVCKAEVYKKGTRNVKNEQTGMWEKVPVFETDYSHFPVGHGEKSVIRLLRWGTPLTMDEILAIRWHMSAWNLPFQSHEQMANLNAAKDKTPLVALLQCADMLSSAIFEAE